MRPSLSFAGQSAPLATTPYLQAVNEMRRLAMDVQIGNHLVTLLDQTNFNDCWHGGADYPRTRNTLTSLERVPCDDETRVAFVTALAHKHSVAGLCASNFPNPGPQSPDWKNMFDVVCYVIGTQHVERRRTQVSADQAAALHLQTLALQSGVQ